MRDLFVVDAFTVTPFTGNPAGVVLDARGLSDDQMLAVAAELKHSETAFVFPADADDHDVIVRFFTPTAEVPTCGHATVATHFARTTALGLPPGEVVQKTGTGLVQRISTFVDAGRVRVRMNQGSAEFGPVIAGTQLDSLLAALGLTTTDLASEAPTQIVSTGHSKVIVPLRSPRTVDALQPDLSGLAALSGEIACNGYFVFAPNNGDSRYATNSRMFAPRIGIAEDPVTGNGHGPLGAYLLGYDLLKPDGDRLAFTGQQGVTIGRPGTVDVEVARNGNAFEVSIVGDATIAFRADLPL